MISRLEAALLSRLVRLLKKFLALLSPSWNSSLSKSPHYFPVNKSYCTIWPRKNGKNKTDFSAVYKPFTLCRKKMNSTEIDVKKWTRGKPEKQEKYKKWRKSGNAELKNGKINKKIPVRLASIALELLVSQHLWGICEILVMIYNSLLPNCTL